MYTYIYIFKYTYIYIYIYIFIYIYIYSYVAQVAYMLFFSCLSVRCPSLHTLLDIAFHHLAKGFVWDPNGRCSPLSLGALFFQYSGLYVSRFSKLCRPSCDVSLSKRVVHFLMVFQELPVWNFLIAFPAFQVLFFQTLSSVSCCFARISLLQFAHFPNGSSVWVGFAKRAIHFAVYCQNVFQMWSSFSTV